MSKMYDGDGNIKKGETTNQTLARLSLLLRDKKQWPEGFEWDYNKCSTCAMGLAVTKWCGLEPPGRGDVFQNRKNEGWFVYQFEEILGKVFTSSYDGSYRSLEEYQHFWDFKENEPMTAIFRDAGMGRLYGCYNRDHVTPEIVADAIDEYLATQKEGVDKVVETVV